MLFSTQYESPRIRIGVNGSLIVALYIASPDLDDMKALDGIEEALLKTHEKLSMLTVLRQTGAITMAPEVRQYGVALSEKYASKLRGSALVVVARGLGAAMARAVLSGLLLVMRGDLPLKSFATLGEAVVWLRELPSQDPDVARALDLSSVEQYLG